MMAKMKAEVEIQQEEMTARLEAKPKVKMDSHHKKFKVLRGILISQMDIPQARTEPTQEKMKSKMDIHQEKMEATVHSIRSN
jgi:hypothetical protein